MQRTSTTKMATGLQAMRADTARMNAALQDGNPRLARLGDALAKAATDAAKGATQAGAHGAAGQAAFAAMAGVLAREFMGETERLQERCRGLASRVAELERRTGKH